MKSFRQILGEVAQPKPEEERAFKDMHSYETMPHPVALDHQFTGAIGADDLPREKAKRIADQEGDANYDTSYDDAFEYEGPSFAEQVAKNLTDRLSEDSKAVELDEASASVYKDMPKAPGKMVSNRVQVKAFKDTNAMGAFLGKQNDNSWQQTGVAGLKSGKYKIDMVKKGGKPSKNFIKVNEEVELDEAPKMPARRNGKKGAPKMTGDSIAIQRAKDAEHNAAMGRTRTGRKKPVRTMTSTQKSLASMRRECAGEVELDEGTKLKDAINLAKKTLKTSDDRFTKMLGIFNKGGQFIPNDMKFRDKMEKDGYQYIGVVNKDGSVSLKRGFKEAVELDEGFSPKQIEQLKKAYASMPDRLPVDAAQKMGAILKGRSKEELIAIARADIKWLSTTAATNLIMQGVKAKEITGK